jgi:sugar (pentulose or hexulose) kinase
VTHLLGVDFGTTNVKAVVFSENGAVVSNASTRTPVHSSGNLRAEYDAEECWHTVAATIRAALSDLPESARIEGLAISSMA